MRLLVIRLTDTEHCILKDILQNLYKGNLENMRFGSLVMTECVRPYIHKVMRENPKKAEQFGWDISTSIPGGSRSCDRKLH